MAMRIGPTASVLLPPVPEDVPSPLPPGVVVSPLDSGEPCDPPAGVDPAGVIGPPGDVDTPDPPADVDPPDTPPVFMPVPVPSEFTGPVGSAVCIDPLSPLSVIEDTVGPSDTPDIILPDIPDIIPVLAVFCETVVIGAQVKSPVSIYPALHVMSHLSFPFTGQLSLQFLSQML